MNVEERIRKLLALAGNNPNENEASAAAEKAAALALQHGIEIASVGADGSAPDIRVSRDRHRGPLDPWRRVLAEQVAKSMGGKTIYSLEYRKWYGDIDFFGPLGTTAAMVEMYTYLERTLDTLSKLEAGAVAHRNAAQSMRWRRSWLLGAVLRLSQRLEARRSEAAARDTGSALVVLKGAVDRAVEAEYPDLVKDGYKPSAERDAFQRGAEAAGSIGLGDAELRNTGELRR